MATELGARRVEVATSRESRRTVLHCRVLAREQTLSQRRVGEDADVVLPTERDDLAMNDKAIPNGVLDNAVQKAVRQLVGDNGGARVENPLHVLASVVGNADRSHLPLLHEFANDGHVHFGRDLVVRPVDLEEIHIVGLEVFERALEGGAKPVGLQVVPVHLGSDHVLFSFPPGGLQCIAQRLLGYCG